MKKLIILSSVLLGSGLVISACQKQDQTPAPVQETVRMPVAIEPNEYEVLKDASSKPIEAKYIVPNACFKADADKKIDIELKDGDVFLREVLIKQDINVDVLINQYAKEVETVIKKEDQALNTQLIIESINSSEDGLLTTQNLINAPINKRTYVNKEGSKIYEDNFVEVATDVFKSYLLRNKRNTAECKFLGNDNSYSSGFSSDTTEKVAINYSFNGVKLSAIRSTRTQIGKIECFIKDDNSNKIKTLIAGEGEIVTVDISSNDILEPGFQNCSWSGGAQLYKKVEVREYNSSSLKYEVVQSKILKITKAPLRINLN